MKVVVTPAAETDLGSIADWIAAANPIRALSFISEVRDAALRLGEFPNAWPARPQWGDGVRIRIVGQYIVAYHVRAQQVEVLRVLHSARDLDHVFSEEPISD